MSKKSFPTTVLAMVAAIFVTASVIIGIAFALSMSSFGGFNMTGTVEVGGNNTTTVKKKSSPLDLVPNPEDLGEGHVVGTDSGQIVSERPASDDDGELHNGWDSSVSYGVTEERYAKSEILYSKDYDCKVGVDFNVTYPQLVDAGEHTDEVNEAIRTSAISFVDEYWDHPTEDAVRLLKGVIDVSLLGVPEDADALLSNEVTWAITYNTPDFISVSFSEEFCVGSWAGEFIRLRTVNANLKTGELYTFDDVLAINEDIANAFVDTLVENAGEDNNGDGYYAEDECFSVTVVGREEWVRALLGKGEFARRVIPTFFIDEKGRVNLGVTYWMSGDNGYVRGWWDTTLTDEQVAAVRKESSMWDLVIPREATSDDWSASGGDVEATSGEGTSDGGEAVIPVDGIDGLAEGEEGNDVG